MRRPLEFVSLFAGIGGLDLGLERSGWKCAGQVEIDPACRSVLERHWSHVPKFADVSDVHGSVLPDRRKSVSSIQHGTVSLLEGRQRAGDPIRSSHHDDHRAGRPCAGCLPAVDLVVGGFPCQDISVAGKRAGLAGQRSGLWWEFHRILAELAPRWVVIENVPGLLSSCGCEECRPPADAVGSEAEDEEAVAEHTKPEHRGRDMLAIVEGLAELGYGWAYRVLDAQHFGVPQRRRRVFIVGHLGEPWSAAAEVLFEPESLRGDSAPSRPSRKDVASTLGGGSGSRGWAPSTNRMTFVPETLPALTAGAGTNCMSPGYNRDGLFIPETTTALLASADNGYDMDGTGRGTPIIGFHPTQDPINGPIAPAMGGESGPMGVQIGSAVRRLSPTECERLQGFPDGWTAEGADGPQADSTRYRELGNAVAVPVVKWIGRRLMQVAERHMDTTTAA